jgi:hypothetical protein
MTGSSWTVRRASDEWKSRCGRAREGLVAPFRLRCSRFRSRRRGTRASAVAGFSQEQQPERRREQGDNGDTNARPRPAPPQAVVLAASRLPSGMPRSRSPPSGSAGSPRHWSARRPRQRIPARRLTSTYRPRVRPPPAAGWGYDSTRRCRCRRIRKTAAGRRCCHPGERGADCTRPRRTPWRGTRRGHDSVKA